MLHPSFHLAVVGVEIVQVSAHGSIVATCSRSGAQLQSLDPLLSAPTSARLESRKVGAGLAVDVVQPRGRAAHLVVQIGSWDRVDADEEAEGKRDTGCHRHEMPSGRSRIPFGCVRFGLF